MKYLISVLLLLVAATDSRAEAPKKYADIYYPALDNIQLDEGTVELWVIGDFDSDIENKTSTSWCTPFDLVFTEEKAHFPITFLTWGHALAQIGYGKPQQSYVWSGKLSWKPGESHAIAWTWSGRKRSLFVDGVCKWIGKGGVPSQSLDQVVEGPIKGNLSRGELHIGSGHSLMAIDEVRISSIARTPEEIAATWKDAPKRDAYTLLIDHCDGTITVGKAGGATSIIDGKFGKAIRLWGE